MGKCKKLCPADTIVLNAAAEAYANLGSSDVPTLRYLLENPETGFLTYYYLTGKSDCSSKCNAELFASAISALAKINYFLVPVYQQQLIVSVTTEYPPALVAYYTLLYLLQLYIEKTANGCASKQYTTIFKTAFCTINEKGVAMVTVDETVDETVVAQVVPVINLPLITATAHYVAINLGCTPISIVNAQVGSDEAVNPIAG